LNFAEFPDFLVFRFDLYPVGDCFIDRLAPGFVCFDLPQLSRPA
jgi:hypothetical protein